MHFKRQHAACALTETQQATYALKETVRKKKNALKEAAVYDVQLAASAGAYLSKCQHMRLKRK